MDPLLQIALILFGFIGLGTVFKLINKRSPKHDEPEETHVVENDEPGFWETFEDSDGDVQLYRKEVPGGWLYIHDTPGSETVMTFVPFPAQPQVSK